MNQKPLMNYLGVGTDIPRPHDRQRRAIKNERSTTEAAELSKVVDGYARTLQAVEFEERLLKLEKAVAAT